MLDGGQDIKLYVSPMPLEWWQRWLHFNTERVRGMMTPMME